jgi:hypothetical protein
LNVDAPNQLWHLTRRANQRHIVIIADIVKLAPGKSAAGFFICNRCYPQESFKLSNLLHHIFRNLLAVRKAFDTSGKSGAHQHHRENCQSPGGEIRRGLFV